jgi:hypothetical protein
VLFPPSDRPCTLPCLHPRKIQTCALPHVTLRICAFPVPHSQSIAASTVTFLVLRKPITHTTCTLSASIRALSVFACTYREYRTQYRIKMTALSLYS